MTTSFPGTTGHSFREIESRPSASGPHRLKGRGCSCAWLRVETDAWKRRRRRRKGCMAPRRASTGPVAEGRSWGGRVGKGTACDSWLDRQITGLFTPVLCLKSKCSCLWYLKALGKARSASVSGEEASGWGKEDVRGGPCAHKAVCIEGHHASDLSKGDDCTMTVALVHHRSSHQGMTRGQASLACSRTPLVAHFLGEEEIN